MVVNSFLDQGYVTLSFHAPEAKVEFINHAGKKVRTIASYKPDTKIGINRLPKGDYTLHVSTPTAEKTLLFNLK